MTAMDSDALAVNLRAQAGRKSDALRMIAQAKSLRNSDGADADRYPWTAPEQTLEWEAANTIERQAAKNERLREGEALGWAKATAWHHHGVAWHHLEQASRDELLAQARQTLKETSHDR